MSVGHDYAEQLTSVFEADVDTDKVLRSLESSQRRYVLALLADRDEAMSLVDVATDVTARELDASRDEISRESIQSVHVSLYHNHGPMLADAGLVEYDPERRTIGLTDVGRHVSRACLPSIE